MKTLVRTDNEGNHRYQRVKDSTARDRRAIQTKIKNGWSYCPKSEWKSSVRDRGVK